LINQAKLIGVLYLENNLAPHVFNPTRIAALQLLASQAAISWKYTSLPRSREREAKIRRLVDANVMGIGIWNFEGEIIEANEALLRMVEYSREDLVSGRVRWTDLTPSEWRDRDETRLAEAEATGTIQPFEKEFFRKDGSRVPVLVGAAMFEGQGNEGVAFVLDLSEQKAREEASRRSEAYLAEAQRLTHTGSWALSPSNPEHVYWSSEFFRIFGFDPARDKARRFAAYERIHPDDRCHFDRIFEEAIRKRTDFDAHYRIVLPDGTVKHVHGVAIRLSTRGASLLSWLAHAGMLRSSIKTRRLWKRPFKRSER